MTSWVVDDAIAGERADVALAKLAGVGRSVAQAALRDGTVTLGGSSLRPAHRVALGDVLEGTIDIPEVAAPGPEDNPLQIAFEDERLMVISKPAGLVTHPAGGHESGTLVNALLNLGRPLALAGSDRPGIVHRLDKDTSGLLLVAKDDEAHSFLVSAMKERAIDRRYLGLVKGSPRSPRGTVDAPVDRHPTRRTQMAVVAGGRPAVTHWQVLDTATGVALLEVTLDTGRTHQIRVHLAHLGNPVLGDRTYGGATEAARRLGLTRPFLHAWKLSFPRPAGGRVDLTDPLPADLAGVLSKAGIDAPQA